MYCQPQGSSGDSVCLIRRRSLVRVRAVARMLVKFSKWHPSFPTNEWLSIPGLNEQVGATLRLTDIQPRGWAAMFSILSYYKFIIEYLLYGYDLDDVYVFNARVEGIIWQHWPYHLWRNIIEGVIHLYTLLFPLNAELQTPQRT